MIGSSPLIYHYYRVRSVPPAISVEEDSVKKHHENGEILHIPTFPLSHFIRIKWECNYVRRDRRIRLDAVLQELLKHPNGVTAPQLAQAQGVSRSALYRHLEYLQEVGRTQKVGQLYQVTRAGVEAVKDLIEGETDKPNSPALAPVSAHNLIIKAKILRKPAKSIWRKIENSYFSIDNNLKHVRRLRDKTPPCDCTDVFISEKYVTMWLWNKDADSPLVALHDIIAPIEQAIVESYATRFPGLIISTEFQLRRAHFETDNQLGRAIAGDGARIRTKDLVADGSGGACHIGSVGGVEPWYSLLEMGQLFHDEGRHAFTKPVLEDLADTQVGLDQLQHIVQGSIALMPYLINRMDRLERPWYVRAYRSVRTALFKLRRRIESHGGKARGQGDAP